jgi:aryl-alcohol dehydrogenase-like predicted oxidoreductase
VGDGTADSAYRRRDHLRDSGIDLFWSWRGKALPDFARELDCTSWAQFMLKWIIAHPAVTCVIPATANPQHLEDDLRAGLGRLPDAKQREQMLKATEL